MIELIILFIIAGILVKTADDLADETGEFALGIVIGAVYGLIFAFLMTESMVAATVLSGLILGNVLAKKFDSTPHMVALATIIIAVMFYGNFSTVPWAMGVFLAAAFADEKLHDAITKGKRAATNKFAAFIGENRLLAEFAGIMVAVALWEPLYFAAVLFTDLGYHMAAFASKKARE